MSILGIRVNYHNFAPFKLALHDINNLKSQVQLDYVIISLVNALPMLLIWICIIQKNESNVYTKRWINWIE